MPQSKLSPTDEAYLKAAIAQAEKSYREGGIPIGAALAVDGVLVGVGHNRRMQQQDAILHAEMDCLRNAGRLSPAQYAAATIYSTLSPCAMCSGTVLMYGIRRVVLADDATWQDPYGLLKNHGIEAIVARDSHVEGLLQQFIREHPEEWGEDVGGKT